MRRTFALSRRLYLKLPWKLVMYLACVVIIVQIVKDISEIGGWTQNKLNVKHPDVRPRRITNEMLFVPGKFLEASHPTSNLSHCNERWNILNSYANATGSPELGLEGPYRVHYGVINSAERSESVLSTKTDNEVGCTGKAGVTYVTHATPEYLYHIAELLGRWEGPISVAVFAPGTDAGLTNYILSRLCRCLNPQQASRLSVHIIFHIKHPPILQFEQSDFEEDRGCGPPSLLNRLTYRTKMPLAYPVNVARNVARAGAKTPHIIVSDVELLPSKNLASQFCSMLSKANKRQGPPSNPKDTTADFEIPLKIPLPQPAVSSSGGIRRLAFVVPVFEVEVGEKVPETKEQLLALLASDRAFYFHRWQCVHCQKFPGIHLWMERKKGAPGSIQPLVMVRREFPYHRWEPIYIGTNREPLYSELLMWEGLQDKMTQMHEMCLMGYRFVILDRAFLVHTPGVKRPPLPLKVKGVPVKKKIVVEVDPETQKQKEWLKNHERRNNHLYEMIVESMNLAHPRNPKCKTH